MITYVGEHLWPYYLGNFFVILAFVCSLAAAFSYFYSVQKPEATESWRLLGRKFFYLHSISVIGIIATIFYMIFAHMYEYYYVWEHSSNSMPMQYIFACFWEGQEGSFLLWSFWHVVIGNILIRKSKDWEAPVMATVSLVQTFLGSMILGVYFLEYKLGSNPFTVLTREVPEFANLPWVQMPDYLSKFDGRGLNPLLQNYWMTIHPPTLFLGFAATVVPFAFAIAGLWTKRYTEWQKPALPWAFFGVMILGTGILMGGAWAYEALSFGGFWAWDPVENSSLVPWLVLVGGAHVMMITKNRGQSLFSSFLLVILAFLLILYSTFLTRSGILGNSSVHSFTDLGLMRQLLIYVLFFVGLAAFLLIKNYKKLPKEATEESIWSREFWMFIGALVLLLSCLQITFVTSFPVINKIFGTSFAIGAEGAIKAYNKWQIPFAIVIVLLIAIGQFFKYKKTDPKEFIRKIGFAFIVSLAISIVAGIAFKWINFSNTLLLAGLLFACLFSVFANLNYWINILKGKLDNAGASIAHIGFSLLLLGALISTSRSDVISRNYKNDVEFLGKDFSNNENIMLIMNDTIRMGEYYVTYHGKHKEGINVLFDVEYMKLDTVTKKYISQFTLHPFWQLNERMGNAPEPDTKHYLTSDVYTHVMYADISFLNEKEEINDYGEPHNSSVSVGDTIFAYNGIMVFEGIEQITDTAKYHLGNPTLAVGAKIKIYDFYKNVRNIMPIYALYDSTPVAKEVTVEDLGLKVAFWNIDPENKKVDISFSQKKVNKNDFIVMKAVVFPFINILWLGCLIMIIGTLLALRHRIKRQ